MQNPYATFLSPPAPFVVVRLENLLGTAVSDSLLAQLDTGADRTVIPAEWVDQLGLSPTGTVIVVGLGGEQVEAPVYAVRLSIAQVGTVDIRVIASPGEQWTLLGRDVLNRYRVVLDGPAQRLEIT